MTESNKVKNANKRGLGYRLFYGHVKLVHDVFFYRRTYRIDVDSIPRSGPLMIVTDHQNGLADIFGLLFSIRNRGHRKIRLVARASVFKPVFVKALDWLGILPAFRMSHEGEDALSNNETMIGRAQQELLDDGTVVICPEAGHQDKHWLGPFSFGYTYILFGAAEKTGFTKELFVLPSCNHYSDYFHMQEQILIRFGTPIPLSPFYELYKTRPRTAQRQVNELVRRQIADMMLNITDLDNYWAVDAIRNTYGVDYARQNGLAPEKLDEKLISDKRLFERLESAKAEYPEKIESIYNSALALSEETKNLKIEDRFFRRPPVIAGMILEGLCFLILLPLFVFACIPNLLIYLAPKTLTSKMEDRMLHGGVDIAMSAIVTMPVLYTAMFLITLFSTKSVIIALIYLVFLPFLGIFAWYYAKNFGRWVRKIRFIRLPKNKISGLKERRVQIYGSLDGILSDDSQQ